MIQQDIYTRLSIDDAQDRIVRWDIEGKDTLTVEDVINAAIEETVIQTMTFVRTHRHASAFTCKAVIDALKGA